MAAQRMPETIRAVDIFAGCGGLSLGFDLFRGDLRYEVAMALDNSPQAVRCYNDNSTRVTSSVSVARLCDLTWFSHSSEVLLYYLVHLGLSTSDPELVAALQSPEIGLRLFLSSLRSIDDEFQTRCRELAENPTYRAALSDVDDKIFSIAICKAFFTRLGLLPPRAVPTASPRLAWQEEYRVLECPPVRERSADPDDELVAMRDGLEKQWHAEVSKLADSSGRRGRGQHAPVAARLKTLVHFLRSEEGALLRATWLEWRSQRDYVRARFCTAAQSRLEELYVSGRRVQLLLGGPPCKGFSRIGRAVVENLREQGIHSWVSKEYGDERNALLHKYVLFLEALKPNVFIFENVRHFQSVLRTPAGRLDAASTLAEALQGLSSRKLHYEISSAVVKARLHAIPQDRERFIMVGFNKEVAGAGVAKRFFHLRASDGEVPLALALLGLGRVGEFVPGGEDSCKTSYETPVHTLMDARMPDPHLRYLKWIRQSAPGQSEAPHTTDAHIVRRARADDMALIEKFAPGHRWMDYKIKRSRTLFEIRGALTQVLDYTGKHRARGLPAQAVLASLIQRTDENLLLRLLLEDLELPLDFEGEHHLLADGYLGRGNDRHGDWFERLSAERPCKTVVAHIGKDTYGYIHPYENRALSIREAARVQAFPDFFRFGSAGVVDGYSMIGDAVPPMLASLFAERLAELHALHAIFNQVPLPNAGDCAEKVDRIFQVSLF